jgi:hypothetical protein
MIVRWTLTVDDGPKWGDAIEFEASEVSRAAVLIGDQVKRMLEKLVERAGAVQLPRKT